MVTEVEGAVINVETLIQPEAPVEDVASDEGSGAVAVGLQKGGEGDENMAFRSGIHPKAVRKIQGNTLSRAAQLSRPFFFANPVETAVDDWKRGVTRPAQSSP